MASTSSNQTRSTRYPRGKGARPAPAVASRIDTPHAVRGASAGFSVLLIGGLLAPMVGMAAPVLGSVWLTLAAIVAFIVSARRIGRATMPELQGALAALLSYVLVLPLILPFQAGRNLPQILLTLATAISVGACTGWIQSRRRI